MKMSSNAVPDLVDFTRRGFVRQRVLISLCAVSAVALAVPTVSAFRGGSGRPSAPPSQTQIPATMDNFLMPGTQPDPNPFTFARIQSSFNCTFCHSDYDIEVAPYDTWAVSLMAQSARDPIWHAAVTIANQDANLGGETCIRCHAPGAWLQGKSVTGDLSLFDFEDFDGINCHFCHRMVNPDLGEYSAVGYPAEKGLPKPDPEPDVPIITALAKAGLLPLGPGNAQYIVDPKDTRRGPLDDVPQNMHGTSELGEFVDLIYSPFHTRSEMCGTCHDVSNPLYVRQPDGTFALNTLGEPHPTQNPADMFPEQRTYSEWLKSDFPKGIHFADGRFGGDHPTGVMSSCQDCHMPRFDGGACFFYEFPPFFERNVPQHSFAGANTWVIDAIADLAGEEAEFFGLTAERIEASKARTTEMLRAAADLDLDQNGAELNVRVTNWSGHKLPTGYPEGRRMWLNVKFFDGDENLVAERGAYDFIEATLSDKDTKVYEAKHGMDAATAAVTGLPEGKSFHLALNNVIILDNRIPPVGFTNDGFESVQAEPIGYDYIDGQHWDDTPYEIPAGAATAVVTLYFQTTSREYIEFLRDANVTDGTGQIAYDQWVKHGKSAPLDMATSMIKLKPAGLVGDLNGDGKVDGADLGLLLVNWGSAGPIGDLNGDGVVDGADLGLLLVNWNP